MRHIRGILGEVFSMPPLTDPDTTRALSEMQSHGEKFTAHMKRTVDQARIYGQIEAALWLISNGYPNAAADLSKRIKEAHETGGAL